MTTYRRRQDEPEKFSFEVLPHNEYSTLPTIESCGKNCLCCSALNRDPILVSTVTRKRFSVVSQQSSLSCDSTGLVYLITCAECDVQYVGQTSRSLKARFREHRNSVLKNENSFLYKHFTHAAHSVADLKIQIVETVIANTQNLRSQLLEKEDNWLKVLNTSFPYGLNDSVRGFGLISSNLDPCLSNKQPYFTMPLWRPFRPHGKSKRATRKIDVPKIKQLVTDFNCDSFSPRELYVKLRTLKKREIKRLNAILTSLTLAK